MVTVRFLLFFCELTPTDPGCNIFQTLLGRKKYEEAMSDEYPLKRHTHIFLRQNQVIYL